MKEALTKALVLLQVFVVGSLGALLLAGLNLTLKWRCLSSITPKDLGSIQRGKVIAFWHNRQLLMGFTYRGLGSAMGKGVFALISQHTDGRMIAWAMRLIGIGSVAGSSTRGGKEASIEMIKKVLAGFDVAITPDGPRGPKGQAKRGAVILAKETGAPLYPLSVAFDRAWVFNSWDRMILPKPFAQAVLVIGDPIFVPKELDSEGVERFRLEIETKLNQVDSEAHGYFASGFELTDRQDSEKHYV